MRIYCIILIVIIYALRLQKCHHYIYVLENLKLHLCEFLACDADFCICNLSFHDHVKPALAKVNWLPVKFRILYKLCLFMHHVHYKSAPQYLSDSVQSVATASCNRRTSLHSADTANYVKRCTRTKFGERRFSFAGPAYLIICSTAVTQMHLRTRLRHFSSNVHSTQLDVI